MPVRMDAVRWGLRAHQGDTPQVILYDFTDFDLLHIERDHFEERS
jgi:hypothetical protein